MRRRLGFSGKGSGRSDGLEYVGGALDLGGLRGSSREGGGFVRSEEVVRSCRVSRLFSLKVSAPDRGIELWS